MTDPTDRHQAYLAFPISQEQRDRVREVAGAMREADNPSEIVPEFVALVVELTHEGLGQYFVRPLEVAGVGRLSLAAARMGIASAGKGIPIVIRRVIGSASDEELLELVNFLEDLVVEAPAREEPA